MIHSLQSDSLIPPSCEPKNTKNQQEQRLNAIKKKNLDDFNTDLKKIKENHKIRLKIVKVNCIYIDYLTQNKETFEWLSLGFLSKLLWFFNSTTRKVICLISHSLLTFKYNSDIQIIESHFVNIKNHKNKLKTTEIYEVKLKLNENIEYLKKEFELFLLDFTFLLMDFVVDSFNKIDTTKLSKFLEKFKGVIKNIEHIVKHLKDIWIIDSNIHLLKKYLSTPFPSLVFNLTNKLFMENCESSIISEINKCKDKEFDEIKSCFLKFNIDISSDLEVEELNQYYPYSDFQNSQRFIPPKSKSEWDDIVKNELFIKFLIMRYAQFHIKFAEEFDEESNEMITKKLNEEINYLSYEKIELVFHIILSGAEFCIKWNKKEFPILDIFSFLFSNFLKPLNPEILRIIYAFDIFSPLPSKDCVVIKIAFKFAKFMFELQYKPNVYSLEYQLILIKKRFINIILRPKIYLINLFIETLEKTLKNKIENFNGRMKSVILFTNNHLTELIRKNKLEDQELETCYNVLIQKQKAIDEKKFNKSYPIEKKLFKNFENINIECLPREVVLRIQRHYGYSLTNENKTKLKNQIKMFYRLHSSDFIKTYHMNRSIDLKRTAADRQEGQYFDSQSSFTFIDRGAP